MKRILTTLTEDPPEEDSEDLTDDEIELAVATNNPDDLAQLICSAIKESRKFTLQSHELRRRGARLFWRSRLVCAREPDRVLIYGVDWLGGSRVNEM